MLIFEAEFFDFLLLVRVVLPLVFGAFVAADVNELGGEDVHDFGEDIFAELDCGGLGVKNARVDSPAREDLVLLAISEFGIGGECGLHVARHVNFGDDVDMAFFCVGDDFAEVVLGVEPAVGDPVVFCRIAADYGL